MVVRIYKNENAYGFDQGSNQKSLLKHGIQLKVLSSIFDFAIAAKIREGKTFFNEKKEGK